MFRRKKLAQSEGHQTINLREPSVRDALGVAGAGFASVPSQAVRGYTHGIAGEDISTI